MSYRIKIRREALRELKELPAYVRAEALQVIDTLGMAPRPPRAKELRGKPGIYRLWLAAHWRLVYRLDDGEAEVWVLRIRRKESIDYESLTWEVREPASPGYSAQLVARTSVSDGFQILLPEEIRHHTSLRPGDDLRIVLNKGVMTLIPLRLTEDK